MAFPEVLIIGGGVAGLAGALALSRRGMSVAVVDWRIDGAASWSGGGILSPLPPWGAVSAVRELSQRGAEMCPSWLDSLGDGTRTDCEYHRCGMLAVWPYRCAGDFEEWRKTARAELVNARDIAPGLCLNDADGGESVWLPDVCQVRPPRVLRALEDELRRRGNVRFLEGCVSGFRSAGDRIVCALGADGGEFFAGSFVVSAGAWSARLSPAPRPDIRPLRGHMAQYQAAGADLRGLGIILFGDGLYLIPRRDGQLLAGGGMEDSGFDAGPDMEMIGRIRKKAEGVINGLSAPERIWTGFRPATPGNIPVVERHSLRENLYFHTGHFRYGLTTAPATAERLAEIVCGR